MSPTNNNVINEKETKSRFSHIEEGLESSLSNEAQSTISRIVNEVKSLSDVEKLFLYLKLPTGDSCKDFRKTPTIGVQKPNRTQQAQTYTWIKSHLEEDELICLPKQDVYDDYRSYCENHDIKPLSTADFGKLMKSVFPNVKPRRLGQRGQSRYCYGGLRKKLDVLPPTLPELEILSNSAPGNEDDELNTASCQLVCEWAHKLLNANFQGIRDLAEYLISNLCVNSKSVAAFTVIAAMEDAGIQNIKEPSLFSNTTGGDRHRETQMLLQRKLQEGKLLREQKKKLQQQREENEQKLKESHDRQTPFITSPSIQQVIKSPVKRLFEDGGSRSKSVQGKTDLQRSQSVMVVQQQNKTKQERSKSISEVDVEMVSDEKDKMASSLIIGQQKRSDNNKNQIMARKNQQVDPARNLNVEIMKNVQMDQNILRELTTVHGEENTANVNFVLECDAKTNPRCNIEQRENRNINNRAEIESRSSDEVDGNRPVNNNNVLLMEVESEKTSSQIQHIIRKPSLISANVWNIPVSIKDNNSFDANIETSVGNESIKQLLNSNTSVERTENDSANLISSANHSSRSAFVPFSQIQSRKDSNSDLCKGPSINLTQSDGQIFITVPNNFDITKLPSHYLEKIEQVAGQGQPLKKDRPSSSLTEAPKRTTENLVGKVLFQPVLQSGIIAPSNLVVSSTNMSTIASSNPLPALASSTISMETTNKVLKTGTVLPQQVTSDGKLILPAHFNIGGSSGIVLGQGQISDIGKNVNSVPTPAHTVILPVTTSSSSCSQLLKQMARAPEIALLAQQANNQKVLRRQTIGPVGNQANNQNVLQRQTIDLVGNQPNVSSSGSIKVAISAADKSHQSSNPQFSPGNVVQALLSPNATNVPSINRPVVSLTPLQSPSANNLPSIIRPVVPVTSLQSPSANILSSMTRPVVSVSTLQSPIATNQPVMSYPDVSKSSVPLVVPRSSPISSVSTSLAILNSPSQSSMSSFKVVNSTPTTLCSIVPPNNQETLDNSLHSNPSTPKKSTKSRFAPIRPKASPVKTISTILKDTKITPTDNFVYDKSKSVSELLKEKRAREAELALKNKQHSGAQNVTGTINIDISNSQNMPGTINPQMCSNVENRTNIPVSVGSFFVPADHRNVKNLFNVGMPQKIQPGTSVVNRDRTDRLQSGQIQVPPGLVSTGDVVYVINHVPQALDKSPVKSMVARPNTLSLVKDSGDGGERKKGVESPDLNDDDTMDIEDVLKMYKEKENEMEVSCETPSKFAKIEDGDQIVHSRPGSRCSADIEQAGGRKRKFFNTDNGQFRCFGRKRLNSGEETDDDVILFDPLEESSENRRESRSCTFEIDGSPKTNKTITSALKHKSQHSPDISMLEIDALIDLVQPEQPHSVRPLRKVSSAAVGVNSLSLRKSQQQLLKEKPLLDQMINTFLQKKDRNIADFGSVDGKTSIIQNSEIFQHVAIAGKSNFHFETESLLHDRSKSFSDAPLSENMSISHLNVPHEHDVLQSSTGFAIPTDSELPMEADSDLPEEIADFITEQVTMVTGGIMGNNPNDNVENAKFSKEVEAIQKNFHNISNNEMHNARNTLQNFEINSNQLKALQQLQSSRPQSRQETNIEVNKIGTSRVSDRPTNKGDVKFASPQRPVSRRQRTPSVERITSQISVNSALDRRSVTTPTLFPSPIHSTNVRRRETSVDRMTNQTPFSDPGYGSIGASPILNPTPVSQSINCDTSVTSGHNSSFMSNRADSAQSIASDTAMFSPVSSAISPRFQTSTPYPLQSPCPTPCRNIIQSPIDAVGPVQSFVPIQGSQLQIDSNVTLIKPVVTVAMSQSNQTSSGPLQAKEQNKLRKDLIGIGSILPRTEHQALQKPPPSYSDALLSQLQGNRMDQNRLSNKGAFDVPSQGAFDVPSQRNEQAISQQQQDTGNGNSEQLMVAPFSHRLALMSTKYGSRKVNRNSSDLHNRSLPENLLQSNDSSLLPNSGLSQNDEDHEKSLQIESIKASLQNNSLDLGNFIPDFDSQDFSSSQNLAEVRVRRSERKIRHRKSDLAIEKMMDDDDIEFIAKRNLSLDLENNTSFNEDDLETTLEDLKSLDGQYFTHDNQDNRFI
ncbi:DNA-binding protein RFX7,DNA-binding protein Rfx5 [Mytilus coruscus]|uniref:DNA-binding protein RFX7,DNA-binding protein Rfx5 n=1 Tax=Mytilus coruscus TaxID=42192 RepID=A0A6J8ETA0_MYTCO|nr:DNA-binding protein RFX7,DNA-binding protein Rfx5 [Mytilus coruscus]